LEFLGIIKGKINKKIKGIILINYHYWSKYLHQAERNVQDIEPILDNEKLLSVNDGYTIQELVIDYRLKDGENVIGVKAALTSVEKQQVCS